MLYSLEGILKHWNIKYGKGHEGHGWIETEDFVYDPSLMLRFEKNTYYSLYGSSKVTKIDKQTYLSQHKDFVDAIVTHDLMNLDLMENEEQN